MDRNLTEEQVITLQNFFDCECDGGPNNFIHLKEDMACCPKCMAHHEDQPDARLSEIITVIVCMINNHDYKIALRWLKAVEDSKVG